MTLYDRIAGCLLAGALGDAIGAWFENAESSQFAIPRDLRVTDDTQLTIATCEAIAAESHVCPEAIAARMVDWFRNRRINGIGASTLKSLTELNAGGHWAMVGATGERAAGNGAAMRISPLAFFLDPNDAAHRKTIRDVCRITHRNDEAYLGALAIIHSIHENQLDLGLIDVLIFKLPDSRLRDRFLEIREDGCTVSELASRHRPTGYVVDSVPFAVLAAVESTGVMDSIKSIVEFGGDTDTVASICGNIYGAFHGASCLPMEIVQQIDEFELVSQTAADLFRVVNVR